MPRLAAVPRFRGSGVFLGLTARLRNPTDLRARTHKQVWSKAAGNVRYSTLCGLNSDVA